MGLPRIAIVVFVLIVTILKFLFAILRLRLKNYRLPFEIVYFLAILISVVNITQYIRLYMGGGLSSQDFGISFLLEIGVYTLNMVSMVTYAIKREVAKLTADIYDKCDLCGGDLYAYGPPETIKDHCICGSCIQAINENKTESENSGN